MTYNEVKEKLNPASRKNLDTDFAILSHLIHCPEFYGYRESAQKLMADIGIGYEDLTEIHEVEGGFDVPFPPSENPMFDFIDLFAGIGGFRIALQSVGGRCVFSSEIDKAARKTYEQNFGECPFGDIRKFTNASISQERLSTLIPNHDILAAGFPCQPFSLAGVSARNSLGKVHGFEDINQGNLFFDIVRIVEAKQPDVVFLENVKNFRNHDHGNTFREVKRILEDELNYKFYSKVINSNKAVPQNRERTYIVCFRDHEIDFQFPIFEGEPIPLGSILENDVPEEYTISDRLWQGHQNRTRRNLERGTGFTAFTADLTKPSKTLVARYGKDGKECLVPQPNRNPRKLTPRECARLQGFPENYLLPDSNAAAYRQFGNSVSVPVIRAISQNIINALIVVNAV